MDNFNLQAFVKKSKDEYYTNLYEGKKKHSMEEKMHDDDHKMEGEMHDDDHKMEEKMHHKDHKMEEKMHDDDHKMEGEKHHKDHKMEENHQNLDPEVAERIEGLLNIPMKAKFLSVGVDLINDFLQDEAMDVEDVVSHLANELEKEYHTAGDHDTAVALDEGEDEEDPHEMDETVEEDLTNEVSLNVSDVEAAMSFLGGALGLPAVAFLSAKAQEKLKAMKDKKAVSANLTEEEEIEIEDETPAMDLDMSADKPDNKEVFSQLVDAYESAKELGDEKLTRQLANTITYFNKTIIFGDED